MIHLVPKKSSAATNTTTPRTCEFWSCGDSCMSAPVAILNGPGPSGAPSFGNEIAGRLAASARWHPPYKRWGTATLQWLIAPAVWHRMCEFRKTRLHKILLNTGTL